MNAIKNNNISIQYIKGIGPKRADALAKYGICSIRDLLYYFPYDYLDLSKVVKIKDAKSFVNSGKWITVIGTVRSYTLKGKEYRKRFSVILGDETDTIELVFFQSHNYFKNLFKLGETIAASGKVTAFRNLPQIIHPSIDKFSNSREENKEFEGFLHTGGIVPKYGSSEELKSANLDVKAFRRIMKTVVDEYATTIEEVLPQEIIQRNNLLSLPEAISSIHFPKSYLHLEKARYRLKFDELFLLQLILALRRKSIKVETPGISFNIKSKLARQLVNSLDFKLTKAQVRVINEIANDMKSNRPMNRLLQGDVGSGKTIVALIAILIAVENGFQTAFMAPTEILAEQHYQTLVNFLKNIPVNIKLLIGGIPTKQRNDILENISQGLAQIVVGTHALIQEDVKFAKLGLVIIDEQHRFGVTQRFALKEKGMKSNLNTIYPDVLVMTATPIPRTLSLTLYGDLDVSVIDELPKGRQIIKTIHKKESQINDVYELIKQEIIRGRQAYIVYPLIEESEKIDLKAATESYEILKTKVFPNFKVGLIHGRMNSNEKETIMSSFKEHQLDILVSTTVIEVGIDIPNASIMVIVHAERFGLSQLHQLRGRIGRGSDPSLCVLITPDWVSNMINRQVDLPYMDKEQEEMLKAAKRITALLEYTDGFKIAEIDLELRGPGDFFGTRQSGLPKFQIANLMTDQDIMAVARQEAFQLIDTDPHLRLSSNQPLRKYLLEKIKEALTLVEVG